MFKTIQSITFVYENCDSVTFPGNEIEFIEMPGVIQDLTLHFANATIERRSIDQLILILKSSANQTGSCSSDYDAFPDDPLYSLHSSNDVTSIELTYDDQTTETFLLSWVGDSDHWNYGQSSKVCHETEKLYFVLHPEQTVDDCFPLIKDKFKEEKRIKQEVEAQLVREKEELHQQLLDLIIKKAFFHGANDLINLPCIELEIHRIKQEAKSRGYEVDRWPRLFE